jgi:hypothetical protein
MGLSISKGETLNEALKVRKSLVEAAGHFNRSEQEIGVWSPK